MEIKNRYTNEVIWKNDDIDTFASFDFGGANLTEANLSWANLTGANLTEANLSWANLTGANLTGANLTEANLTEANLTEADLTEANLSWANLTEANLSWANLTGANLILANLYRANLSGANLSSANLTNTQLPNPNDILKQNFKFNELGMIVYKMFGNTSYTPNKDWKIEENSMISETCNWNRQDACGCGVNFGTEEWVKENYPNNDLWECLVPIEYLMGIVVPLNFEGKARCSNLILIKKIS